MLWAIAAVGVVVVVLAVAVVSSGGDDDDDGSQAARTDTTVTTPGPTTTESEGEGEGQGEVPGSTATTGDASATPSPAGSADPEVVVSRPKVVDPPPSCPDLISEEQVSEALGAPLSFNSASVNDGQPCMFRADPDGGARTVIVATTSSYGGLSTIGIEDPSASTGPSDYEGNTRFEFLDEEEGLCTVHVAVADDGIAPFFLSVSVGAQDPDLDMCAVANSLQATVFAAIPDA